MAGDVATRVGLGHSGLPAQRRDENIVEVGFADYRESIQKEKINHLTGLRVWQFHTLRADLFPGGYRFSDSRINRLGECC